MAAGSISLEEFNDLTTKLLEISTKLNDTWVLKYPLKDGDEQFVEKIVTVKDTSLKASENPAPVVGKDEVTATLLTEEIDMEDADPNCLEPVAGKRDSYLQYKFHVVYSHSYSVPVLYFNACREDGKRLSLEELWSRVPAQYQERMEHHKWATLTQQEHPYLGSPFFMLHPCHTATLMSQVPCPQDKSYYLIKWLSSVGPVVGLDVLSQYATAFDNKDNT